MAKCWKLYGYNVRNDPVISALAVFLTVTVMDAVLTLHIQLHEKHHMGMF